AIPVTRDDRTDRARRAPAVVAVPSLQDTGNRQTNHERADKQQWPEFVRNKHPCRQSFLLRVIPRACPINIRSRPQRVEPTNLPVDWSEVFSLMKGSDRHEPLIVSIAS